MHEPHPEREAEPLQRVRDALARYGRPYELRNFAEPLKTAALAAETLGIAVGQVAKSILFLAGGDPVLVVAAGDRRVDRQKVKRLIGKGKVSLASPAEVLEMTGFVAGGVAPVGLLRPAQVLLDASLRRFETIWAGGGVPEALLRLAVADLPLVTGGRFADVVQDP